MNKVLLTTVYGPFGKFNEGFSVGNELFHKQLTFAQGIFSVRQILRSWGLDLMAANLKTPTTVYHYPSLRAFKKEITKHHYSHIGINFVAATFHRAKEMSAIIRKLSPNSKIIYGGYGTVIPKELLDPHCDYICKGDGVPFMRELMGEDINAPRIHPFSPSLGPEVLSYRHPGLMGHITAGLGCPNGCDFCCTSHFYSRQYVPFISDGKELFRAVQAMYKEAENRGEKMLLVSLIDEDFFHNETRARDFLEEVRRTKSCIGLAGFSSIRSLSKFTAAEIAEMGFDMIWVGIEGKNSGYEKLAGVPVESLFNELRSYGICLVASSIVGLPYHTREIIREEFEYEISLKPTYSQYTLYLPIPGTPLYKKATEQDLFLPEYKDSKNWKQMDSFHQFLKHENFEKGELEKIQLELYAEENRRLGASTFRILDTMIYSIEKLENSDSPILKMRAERLKQTIKPARPILPIGSFLAPSIEVKENIKRIGSMYHKIFGAWNLRDSAAVLISPFLALFTYFRSRPRFDNRLGSLRIDYSKSKNNLPEF